MTRQSEPITQPRSRGRLEQAWAYIGLAIVMLLCCVAVPESVRALAAGSTQVEIARSHARPSDAPAYGRAERGLRSTTELRALETEEEDATSDTHVVASAFGLVWGTPNHHVRTLERVLATETGHLLVSTGLGRGPPLG